MFFLFPFLSRRPLFLFVLVVLVVLVVLFVVQKLPAVDGPFTRMTDLKVSRKSISIRMIEGGSSALMTVLGINAVYVIKPKEFRYQATYATTGGAGVVDMTPLPDKDADTSVEPPGGHPHGKAVETHESAVIEDGDTLVFAHPGTTAKQFKENNPYLPIPGHAFVFRILGQQ